MVIILSLAEAKAAGVAATAAPAAAANAVFSGVLFQTVISWSNSSSRSAIAVPIRPVPAIPIFISLSCLNRASQTARASTATAVAAPCRLEKEPHAPFRLVNPGLYQAGARHIPMFAAKSVRFAKPRRELFIVVAQLRKHIEGRNVLRVVVQNALETGNVTDGAQRRSADFAHALGDAVGGREDLAGLLVHQEVVVAEVRAGHVPVEIFSFQVQGEHVRQERIECSRNIVLRICTQIRWRAKRNVPGIGSSFDIHDLYSFSA